MEAGPDRERDGVARWRCVDLKWVSRQRFAADLSEVSLGRVLKKQGFSHISARPRHPAQDGQAIDAAKYFAWRLNKPLHQFPTSPSVDAVYGQRAGVRDDGIVKYVGWTILETVYFD